MKPVTVSDLTTLYSPSRDSHKGQNGKLLIIGGSHLFHAASLWALAVASRIVDLVHYSSVPENNELVMRVKSEFRDGIVVPRHEVERYIEEDDAILIGPGMVRAEHAISNIPSTKLRAGKYQISNIRELENMKDEGQQTAALTNYLLRKYPAKQWVIDAGALQMMDVALIPQNAILTPHRGEFSMLKLKMKNEKLKMEMEKKRIEDQVKEFANVYKCIVLLKGERDVVCIGEGCEPSTMEGSHPSGSQCLVIEGGNAGMTKGGTGDVLAGLVAALACKNNPFSAALAGSFINKKAGDALYEEVGTNFNASDLSRQIPKTMKTLHVG